MLPDCLCLWWCVCVEEEEEMAASIYRGDGQREPWRSIGFLKCCTVEEYLHPLIDHSTLNTLGLSSLHCSHSCFCFMERRGGGGGGQPPAWQWQRRLEVIGEAKKCVAAGPPRSIELGGRRKWRTRTRRRVRFVLVRWCRCRCFMEVESDLTKADGTAMRETEVGLSRHLHLPWVVVAVVAKNDDQSGASNGATGQLFRQEMR